MNGGSKRKGKGREEREIEREKTSGQKGGQKGARAEVMKGGLFTVRVQRCQEWIHARRTACAGRTRDDNRPASQIGEFEKGDRPGRHREGQIGCMSAHVCACVMFRVWC